MSVSYQLLNGLLLLARLYPNSEVDTRDNEVFFNILAKDNHRISNEDKQLLESWSWKLIRYEGLDVWNYW